MSLQEFKVLNFIYKKKKKAITQKFDKNERQRKSDLETTEKSGLKPQVHFGRLFTSVD